MIRGPHRPSASAPAPSSSPRPTGWPRTSAGRSSGSSTSRWRPDGSGARPSTRAATSRAPPTSTGGSTSIEPDEAGDALLLAGPDRMAAAASPRLGIGDGTTVVLYDDTPGLFAARAWWSLRAYGFESVRILDGGFPAWVEDGPTGLERRGHAGRRPRFTPRGPGPDAPDDGRRPRPARLARRDPRSTPARRPSTAASRATPGASATSRARSTCRSAAMNRPGGQRLRDGAELRDQLHARRTSPAAAGSSATTARASRRPSSPSCSRCSATRTSPCTTAAGPSGATGSTCRSTARLGSRAIRRQSSPRATRWPVPASWPDRDPDRRRRRSADHLRRPIWSRPAHGSTSWCGARIWARPWLTATSAAVAARPRRAVGPVGRVGDREEPPGQLVERVARLRSGSRWIVPVTRTAGPR